MLKTLTSANDLNSKCAEIYCQAEAQFCIVCSYCDMRTTNYVDFLKHFISDHNHTVDKAIFELVSYDKCGEDIALEIASFDVSGNHHMEKDVHSNELGQMKTFSINQETDYPPEDEIPLSVIKVSMKQELKGDFINRYSTIKEQHNINTEIEDYSVSKKKGSVILRKYHRKSKQPNDELKCPICGIYKNNKYNLNSHINSHTGARPYNCQQCGNNFTNSGNLWKHIELVHKGLRTHKCLECLKKFQFKSQLRRHELHVHLKMRSFPCTKCNCNYDTKKELNEHDQRFHLTQAADTEITAADSANNVSSEIKATIEQPNKYVCEHCGKLFSKYSGIWAHRRVHTLEKRFVCNVCLKPMHTSYHLKEHMNTHTGERPHKCDVCGKAFQQKKFLRDHARIHSNEKAFVCRICNKKFAQAAGLYCHTKTHREI